jgi:hypothetical protein
MHSTAEGHASPPCTGEPSISSTGDPGQRSSGWRTARHAARLPSRPSEGSFGVSQPPPRRWGRNPNFDGSPDHGPGAEQGREEQFKIEPKANVTEAVHEPTLRSSGKMREAVVAPGPIGSGRPQQSVSIVRNYDAFSVEELKAKFTDRVHLMMRDNFGEVKLGAVRSLDPEIPHMAEALTRRQKKSMRHGYVVRRIQSLCDLVVDDKDGVTQKRIMTRDLAQRLLVH